MNKPATVLLVDDDFDFVQSTRIVLESGGHKVLVAYDGDEALAKVREETPDVVILDVMMPTRDGFSTCSRLKSDPELSKVPVLMLTSVSEKLGDTSYAVAQGLQMEADDFIEKPVRPAELLLRVDRLLGRAEAAGR